MWALKAGKVMVACNKPAANMLCGNRDPHACTHTSRHFYFLLASYFLLKSWTHPGFVEGNELGQLQEAIQRENTWLFEHVASVW